MWLHLDENMTAFGCCPNVTGEHGTRGTQRVNKHSSGDNWCQKSPTFLWSFVCSEKMFVFCDRSSLRRVTGRGRTLAWHHSLLSHYYCLTKFEIELWFFFVYQHVVWGPASRYDRVLRDRANVWHCGSKLIPARIIIRSSSDKSVMICDTLDLRDIDPASQYVGTELPCVGGCRPLCPSIDIPDLVRLLKLLSH